MQINEVDSPIATEVWRELQALLSSETSAYLDSARFVIQKDAYMRLSDEEVESDVPFATYEYAEFTSDSALDLTVYFESEVVTFAFGPAWLGYSYSEIGHSAKNDNTLLGADTPEYSASKAAQNILTIIKLFLSGQIAIGCSWRKGSVVALEIFLLGFQTKPICVGVVNNYGLFQWAADEYTLKQNHLLNEKIKIPHDFPLLPPIVDKKRLKIGREYDDFDDQEPISKKQIQKLEFEANLQELAGKPKDISFYRFFYSSPQFWILIISILSLYFIVINASFTPTLLKNPWFSPIYLLIISTSVWGGTGYLLALRQERIALGHNPISWIIQKSVLSFGILRTLLITSYVLFLVSQLLAPIWTPKSDSDTFYSALQLYASLPILASAIIAPVVAIVLHIIVTNPPVLIRFVHLFLAAVSIEVPFLIEDLYMNPSDSGPGPSELVMTVLFAPMLILAVLSVLYVFAPQKKRSKSSSVDC